MQFPIRVGLRRSLFLASANVLSHLVALLAVIWLVRMWDGAGYVYWLGAVALLLSWWWSNRCLQPKYARLIVYRDASLKLGLVAGAETHQAARLPGSVVHPWLIVLPLKVADKTHYLILAQDSATPDELRRLRVALRWLQPSTR